MKINFEEFPLYKGIGKTEVEVLNIKRFFADSLYTKGQGIDFNALALKVYNSNGEEEYTDEEYLLMIAFSEQMMTPNFIDSLKALNHEKK